MNIMEEEMVSSSSSSLVDTSSLLSVAAAAATVTAAPTTTTHSHKQQQQQHSSDTRLSTRQVCHTIQSALSNMGHALRCPLCLSTLPLQHDCVVVSSCAHAYCRPCILQQLQVHVATTTHNKCPVCQEPMSRRSLLPAPSQLVDLVHAYQRTLRHFGLTPVRYEPSLLGMIMTQLPTDEDINESSGSDNDKMEVDEEEEEQQQQMNHQDKDDEKQDDDMNQQQQQQQQQTIAAATPTKTAQEPPFPNKMHAPSNNNNINVVKNNKNPLVSIHEHVQVSRTFAKALQQTAQPRVWQEQQLVLKANERALLQQVHVQRQRQQQQQQQQLQQQPQPNKNTQKMKQQTTARSVPNATSSSSRSSNIAAVAVLGETNTTTAAEEEEKAKAVTTTENMTMTVRFQPASITTTAAATTTTTTTTAATTTPLPLAPAAAIVTTSHNKTIKKVDVESSTNRKQPPLQPLSTTTPTKLPAVNNNKESTSPMSCLSPLLQQQQQQQASSAAQRSLGQHRALTKQQEQQQQQRPRAKASSSLVASASTAAAAKTAKPTATMAQERSSSSSSSSTDQHDKEISLTTTQRAALAPSNRVNEDSFSSSSTSTSPLISAATASTRATTASSACRNNNIDQQKAALTTKQAARARTPKNNSPPPPASMATAAAPATTTTTIASSVITSKRTVFSVGDIVKVQARTWPGMNKPGGVAKVVAVYDSSSNKNNNQTTCYDVSYILGGKELKVEAVFVSQQEQGFGRSVVSRSSRTAKKTSCRILHKQQQQEDEIPSRLLEQLAKEGFDVNGTASAQVLDASAKKAVASSKSAAVVVGVVTGSKENTHPAGRSRKRQASSGDHNNNDDNNNNFDKRPAKKRNLGRRVVSQLSKVLPAGQKMRNASTASARSSEATCALPDWNVAEMCKLADQQYERRIQQAIQKATVHLVASSLSDVDRTALQLLVKQLKKTNVTVKISDSFHANKTTIVVTTRDSNKGPNTSAQIRTMKGMQAALAGVPIVTPEWIRACLTAKTIVVPETEMYIRSLPSKVPGNADYGVARMAAAMEHMQKPLLPLEHCHVFLCGLSKRKEKDALQVLRQAGANILSHSSSVLAKLKSLNNNDVDEDSRIVLICDESATITGALAREIPNHHKHTLVVNVVWVYDSISSSKPLTADDYCPSSATAKEFWDLIVSSNKQK